MRWTKRRPNNAERSRPTGGRLPSQRSAHSVGAVQAHRPITGVVASILTSSFVDGPGNRAVVFLQGCNLDCLYCHNPYTRRICTTCGDCIAVCPGHALRLLDQGIHWDRVACQGCDRCIRACRYDSTPRTEVLTAEEVWSRIEPLVPFLSGVTVSGGEPTLQTPFLVSLFSRIKQQSPLTTFIETNGIVLRERLEALEPVLDGALVDLKAMDLGLHFELTGRTNSMCLDAIRYLTSKRKLAGVRVVVVPGYSDSPNNAEQTAAFLSDLDPDIPLRFLRFRRHGTSGEAESWCEPDDACLDRLAAAARAAGLNNVSRSL
jgi:pyruvate formate lyase activating enzyme